MGVTNESCENLSVSDNLYNWRTNFLGVRWVHYYHPLGLLREPFPYNKYDFQKTLRIARTANFGRTILLWGAFDRFLAKLFKQNKIISLVGISYDKTSPF